MVNRNAKKETCETLLALLGACYESGRFEPLFPHLADDCVWESQWRLDPETGKEAVMKYFQEKGATMREYNVCPKTKLVELVGDMAPVTAEVTVGEEEPAMGKVGLLYEPGRLALFMSQRLDDETNAVIVLIRVNEDDQITRIDLCMPQLFFYVTYD